MDDVPGAHIRVLTCCRQAEYPALNGARLGLVLHPHTIPCQADSPEYLAAKCSRAVVLNIPNTAILYYSALCCGDPPKKP